MIGLALGSTWRSERSRLNWVCPGCRRWLPLGGGTAEAVIGEVAGRFAFCNVRCLGAWVGEVLAGVEGGLPLGDAVEAVEAAGWELARWT